MAALSIYKGLVTHARLQPFVHRFKYKVLSILIDLDALEAADKSCALFSVDRFNLLSFYSRDFGQARNHKKEPKEPLAAYARRLLEEKNVKNTDKLRITLLCYPRILGRVFNPISVYYAQDDTGALAGIIYEVRNTFGQIHSYVHPVLKEQITGDILRQEQNKELHVSPFLPMNLHYRFRLNTPENELRLRILEFNDKDEPILSATFAARRRPASSASFLSGLIAAGMFAFKVSLAIHFEALKLWLKGAKYHPIPN